MQLCNWYYVVPLLIVSNNDASSSLYNNGMCWVGCMYEFMSSRITHGTLQLKYNDRGKACYKFEHGPQNQESVLY